MTRDEFFYYIAESFGEDYYFGVHGTNNLDAIDLIKKDGLSVMTKGNAYRTAGTVSSIGVISCPDDIYDIMKYSYGRHTAICSFPIMLKNGDESIFMGYSGKTQKGLPKDQDDYKCLMTDLCDVLGYVPPEFILAYKTKNLEQNTEDIELNPNHYSQLSPEQRKSFLDRIKIEIERRPNGNDLLEKLENFSSSNIIRHVEETKEYYLDFKRMMGYEARKDRMILLAEERFMSKERIRNQGVSQKTLLDGIDESLDNIAIQEKMRDLERIIKELEKEHKEKTTDKEISGTLLDSPVEL